MEIGEGKIWTLVEVNGSRWKSVEEIYGSCSRSRWNSAEIHVWKYMEATLWKSVEVYGGNVWKFVHEGRWKSLE